MLNFHDCAPSADLGTIELLIHSFNKLYVIISHLLDFEKTAIGLTIFTSAVFLIAKPFW
jgi:hypothetical protein